MGKMSPSVTPWFFDSLNMLHSVDLSVSVLKLCSVHTEALRTEIENVNPRGAPGVRARHTKRVTMRFPI